ncbi:MAG: hypothetical protein HQK50_11880 [Oligoflexia bacterium]|nr:hypothetical protein [Oligoflexia bacterium]
MNIFYALLPENILVLALLLFPMMEVLKLKSKVVPFAAFLVATVGALAVLAIHYQQALEVTLFYGHYQVSPNLQAIKFLLTFSLLPILLLREQIFIGHYKYYFLLLALLYGSMVMISSGSFITLFVGLALLSIPLFPLILNGPIQKESSESAIKYIIIDSTLTALFLLGIAFIYFATGKMDLTIISSDNVLYRFGCLLLLLSLFIKLAIVPFHPWSPDVYEGCDNRILYILSVTVKATIVFVLWKIFANTANFLNYPWQAIIITLSIASILVGNLSLIKQTSIKRFFAYSSIAHMGYITLILIVTNVSIEIIATIIFAYFAIYSISMLLCLLTLGNLLASADQLSLLEQFHQRSSTRSSFLSFGLLSLAGIPPFPGFMIKIVIMGYLIKCDYTLVAVIAFLASYIGIYPYFKVMGGQFFGAIKH